MKRYELWCTAGRSETRSSALHHTFLAERSDALTRADRLVEFVKRRAIVRANDVMLDQPGTRRLREAVQAHGR